MADSFLEALRNGTPLPATGTAHGHPAETVGPQKQRRIAELATAYIRRHRLEDCQVRVDVVTVTFGTAGEPPEVEHFQNAFDSPW